MSFIFFYVHTPPSGDCFQQESLSLFLTETVKNVNTELKLKKADVIRHAVSAKEQWRKVTWLAVVCYHAHVLLIILLLCDLYDYEDRFHSKRHRVFRLHPFEVSLYI